MDPNFPDVVDRDEECEIQMLQIIAGRAAAPVGDRKSVV